MAPPRQTPSRMCGAARTLPAGHVCAPGEATFGLARCVPASTDASPLAGMGTRVGGGRAPGSLPCPGRQAALGSPRPPASLPRGLGHRGGGSGHGRGCISLPDTSLPPGLYLEGGKSQLGSKAQPGAREPGQGSSVSNASRTCGMRGPSRPTAWQGGCVSPRESRARSPLEHSMPAGIGHTGGLAAPACPRRASLGCDDPLCPHSP